MAMNLFGIQNSDTTFTPLVSLYRRNSFWNVLLIFENFAGLNVNMILHTLFYIIGILYTSTFKFLSMYWTETIIITRIWCVIATNAANLIILVSLETPNHIFQSILQILILIQFIRIYRWKRHIHCFTFITSGLGCMYYYLCKYLYCTLHWQFFKMLQLACG